MIVAYEYVHVQILSIFFA